MTISSCARVSSGQIERRQLAPRARLVGRSQDRSDTAVVVAARLRPQPVQGEMRGIEALGGLRAAFGRPSMCLAERRLPARCEDVVGGGRQTAAGVAGLNSMAAADGHPAIARIGFRHPDLNVGRPVLPVGAEQRVGPPRLGRDIARIAPLPDRGGGRTDRIGDEAAGERLECLNLAPGPARTRSQRMIRQSARRIGARLLPIRRSDAARALGICIGSPVPRPAKGFADRPWTAFSLLCPRRGLGSVAQGPLRAAGNVRVVFMVRGKARSMLGLVSALLVVLAVQGCREDEQDRPLLYHKGSYQGQPEPPLSDQNDRAVAVPRREPEVLIRSVPWQCGVRSSQLCCWRLP